MTKQNNKGFSLIELIVTIAIMGIVLAASVSLYSFLSTAKVRSAASGLEDELTNLRTSTLSKQGDWKLVVSLESNGKYYATLYRGSAEYEKKELGSSNNVTITYSKLTEGAGGSSVASTGNSITTANTTWPTIIFDPGSGACRKAGDYYVTEFVISNTNLTRTIKIIKATGKHYVE